MMGIFADAGLAVGGAGLAFLPVVTVLFAPFSRSARRDQSVATRLDCAIAKAFAV